MLNGLFSLTPKEIDVLAMFYDLSKQNEVNVFSSEFKKLVAKKLGMKNFNTLNVHIKSLKDKKALIESDEGYKIHPTLKLNGMENGVAFIWNQ